MIATVRTLKRKNDGMIKRVSSGPAARLVARGDYEYMDDGADDTNEIKTQTRKRITTIENTPSTVLKTRNIEIVASKLAPEQERRLRSPRVIKTNTIPKQRMDQILATGRIPTPAVISPEKDINALKSIIEKTKETRKRKTV
jgi:hypothetical protein